jgi:hypothetical protein
MSPPDSTGDDSGLPNKSYDSHPKRTVDSLGEALAGVSLHSQTTFGSSALSAALQGTSNEHDGWDSYSAEAAARSSVFSGTSQSNHANNESLHLFLSQDPSQSLGDDVFKLNQQNLPTESAFFSGQSLAPGPKQTFEQIRPVPEPRRDSPSGTGTTATSSRSSSPYESRTIQAYQSSFVDTRKHSSDSSSGYNSIAPGSHVGLGIESRPFSIDQRSYIKYDQQPNAQHPTLVHQQDQQKPQVLYMAVPSPDGRGQVLQQVQMLQLPGKPFAYVVPGTSNVPAPADFFPDASRQLPLPLGGGGGGTADYPDLMLNRANYDRDDFGDEDFFGAPQQRPPLDQLLGQVRRLSRDQVGCRLVQQALDEEGPMAATLILNEGLPFWGEAMVDPFGNYLFQKILEKVTAEERVMLIRSVSTRLVNASLNLHGTRSVQKVVELCAQDEQSGARVGLDESAATILTNSLAPAAARLCIDSHGNHVIQRILLKLGPQHSKFVFDAVATSVGDVARHRHGCCVIQRCLDSAPNEARAHLVRRIVEKSLELMQDAYGNYVVQYVLDVCADDDVQAVCESVAGKVNVLAIQKFSSNVMEKCLERCNERVKEMYLAQMSDPERIRELMMDPFGNYVVQRALSVATHAQAIRLVEAMRPHLIATQIGNGSRNGGVRNTAGGRRIIAKISRRFPNFTLNPVGTHEELYGQNKGNNRHQQISHIHHHPPPPMMQPPYAAAVGGPVPRLHYMNDPRVLQGNVSMQPQQIVQQQVFYGVGGNTGYYDQQFNGGGPGSYPGM